MSARTYHFGTHRWRGECRVSDGTWWEQVLQYLYAFLLTVLVFGGIYGQTGSDPLAIAGMVVAGIIVVVLVFGVRLEHLKLGRFEIKFRERGDDRVRTNGGEDSPEEWREQNR